MHLSYLIVGLFLSGLSFIAASPLLPPAAAPPLPEAVSGQNTTLLAPQRLQRRFEITYTESPGSTMHVPAVLSYFHGVLHDIGRPSSRDEFTGFSVVKGRIRFELHPMPLALRYSRLKMQNGEASDFLLKVQDKVNSAGGQMRPLKFDIKWVVNPYAKIDFAEGQITHA